MKVLITATVQSHISQFHMPLIKMLKGMGYEVHVAAKNNLSDKAGLTLDGADKVFDVPFSRSPFSKKNISAYKMLKKIVRENDYDVIHCNTPVGSVLSRLAGKSARAKIIYTAHGFHFYKGAPIINWLIYFPIEWVLSFCCDLMILINSEDYEFAKKHLHAKNVALINGVGFDEDRFKYIENAKATLGLKENETMLLSVGDINKRKNHKTLIEALYLLKNEHYRLFIAGLIEDKGAIMKLSKKFGVENKVTLLGYERDLSPYLSAADMFLFPSNQEGLPVALAEAMSMNLPVIASDIRGVKDLIKEGEGGYLLKPGDSAGFASKIRELSNSKELRSSFGKKNKENSVKYEKEKVLEDLKKLYEKVIV